MSDKTLTQTCEHGKTEAHFVNPQNDQWSWCKCPTMSDIYRISGRETVQHKHDRPRYDHALNDLYALGVIERVEMEDEVHLTRAEAANDPLVVDAVMARFASIGEQLTARAAMRGDR